MRDPTFAPLRRASVPDAFEQQMARLRAAPRAGPLRRHRTAAVAAALGLVVAACAVPVSVRSPLGYTVRWAVAGVAGEGHTSARALEAAVPEADRLVAAVDPGADSTQFRYVVAGPRPDVALLRADPGAREVRVEALTEPVRVPLGVWAVRRLGASRTVQVGTARLDDARVERLLTGQLAEAGIDTSGLAFAVGRDGVGRRTVRMSARATLDGPRSEITLPVGAGTLVRIRDGVVVMSGFPREVRFDSIQLSKGGPMGRPIVVRQGSDGGPDLAALDSVLRARGLAEHIGDVRRTLAEPLPGARPPDRPRAPTHSPTP